MHRTYGCSENPGRTRPLCDLCGKKFCQPQKLKVHMRRVHSGKLDGTSEFQCQICEKVLGTRHAALRHRKEVHSDIPIKANGEVGSPPSRVDCPNCERTFKNKSNLKIHMLTHSGVKPFGCKIEECQSRFTTKQCLQFHYRKSHNLTDESMPPIEREIPYTLSAYSGGLAIEAKQRKRVVPSNEQDQEINPEKYPSLDPSQDVYDFKESDDDEKLKKIQSYDADDVEIRRSVTSDADENKSGSDVNNDDRRKGDEDDNLNGSSVDADDESDEKTPANSKRVYKQISSKSRFSTRFNQQPEKMEQDQPSSILESSLVVSKGTRNKLQKAKSKYIPSPRTRSSTRSKTVDNELKRMDESSKLADSLHLSKNTTLSSIDTKNPSSSTSLLVLAALSAAEQDLGTNMSPVEKQDTEERSIAPSNGPDYPENNIQINQQLGDKTTSSRLPMENERSVTISTYSETTKTTQEHIDNVKPSAHVVPENNNHLVEELTSSVTITHHRSENDLANENMARSNKEALSSEIRTASPHRLENNSADRNVADNLDTDGYRGCNLYAAQEKINGIPNESSVSRTQHSNSVEIRAVPNHNEIEREHDSEYGDYIKKSSFGSNYTKTDINSVPTYPEEQIKSPIPRQPTPSSSSVIEAHSQYHSNSRSPSSLPPPPSTPHFPANSYPAHFPTSDLAQFSNQLYHSGLDTLARSCYPPFRPHPSSTPTDYSTFPRSSAHAVDFMSHSIPSSTNDGSYNGLHNFSNGTPTGISSSPSSSTLDLSQTSSSSAAAIAAAAVADILPVQGNPRSPFANNSSPSHLSHFYPSHSNMINEHLLNVTAGPKDLTSPRLPPSHMPNSADSSLRQPTNPYIHQNYPLYESSRFPASAASVGYPTPPTPPNNHNRLPHISPGASPYHHYGYFQ